MLNEYNCWLQERKLTSQTITESGLVPERVYAHTAGGEITAQAAEEFRRGIKRLLGFSPAVYFLQNAEAAENAVFLGTVGHLEKLFSLSGLPQKDGGYTIKVTGKQIIIAGWDEAGLLYGVFRFLALLAREKIYAGFELNDAPASPLRMINHWDNLDGTIERGYAGRSIFYHGGNFAYDKKRIKDYARLLASIGINRISINNVNVRAEAKLLITESYLEGAAELAAIFRPFGIRLFLSINFGAPWSLGGLPTADPLDPAVAAWWKERAALVYKYIPDLAGFLVKADSEGEPGPFQYNRNHADGANMLAKALLPHGGEVVWRCFVYNCQQDWRDHSFDRARAAYDNFMPLDGTFDDNVILQIKYGPYDFQVREPVSPLFGALQKTRHVMELQITQEYTGHQIDLCYLPFAWEDIMNFDTGHGDNSKIKELISLQSRTTTAHCSLLTANGIEGFAAVVNVGQDRNWTGHTLAQANLYGYGRIAWNPGLSAAEIAGEWSALSFGETAESITALLLQSYPTYEKYNAPFGVCFMVTPQTHYGPNIEGYEFSRWGTYHRADAKSIGIDRTPKGTGYTSQYPQKIAALLADPASCPENIILFLHRLTYDYRMKNGETLLQNIYDTHFEGYDEVKAMLEQWKNLKDVLDAKVYESVLSRFERQLANAYEWRDQINTYFYRKTGIPDKKGRKIYE